jgi:superfamily II DNA or RNA helicase
MKIINLYDFQIASVEALRENIRQKVMTQVLSSSTGSGKTIIGAHLLEEVLNKGNSCVFILDREVLVNQTSARLDEYDIPHGVIQAQHWRWQPHQKIQIASAQTLERRGLEKIMGEIKPRLIIIDECHTVRKQIVEYIGKREIYTVGLSATPFTTGLGKIYDALVSVTTTNELIAAKKLCNYEVYRAQEVDMKGVKITNGEWDTEETSKRIIPIVGDVVAEYIEKGNDEKFILFGASVADCEEFQRQFAAAGVKTACVTYRTGQEDVEAAMAEYPKPDSHLRGLISVAKLSKGFDAPCVKILIIVRPLRKSLTEHVQIVGRLLRTDPADPGKLGKIFDHSNNWMRFYAETMEFFQNGIHELDDGTVKEKSKAKPAERRPLDCPMCHIIHEPAAACPKCGHEYQRKSKMVVVPGKLVKFYNGTEIVSNDEKQRFYSELLGYAREFNYKPGWAKFRFMDKFKIEAPWLDAMPCEPSQKTRNWVRSRNIAYAKRRPMTQEERQS